MSTQSVFSFNSKFLSATPMPAPHVRKSKLMTRRTEMRKRSQWGSDEIIATAPAIVDIDVVLSLPELVPEDEMITMSPAIVAAQSTTPELELTGTIPTTPAVTSIKHVEIPIKPVHDDRETQNSSSAENANWGIPPQNDATEFPGHASSEIVPAAEITGTSQPMTIVPVAPVDSSNTIRCPIPPAMVSDVTPASAREEDVRRQTKPAKDDGLSSAVKKTRSRKSDKLKGAAAIAEEATGETRLRGDDPAGGNGAHCPP